MSNFAGAIMILNLLVAGICFGVWKKSVIAGFFMLNLLAAATAVALQFVRPL